MTVFSTQVLVDLSGLGRLEWRPWDMFTRPEIGTVAYNSQTFVGRFRHGTSTAAAHFVVGDLDFNRGLSGNIRAFVSANTTEMSIEGEALVELEPIAYRLENISLVSWREKARDSEVTLGSVRLVHDLEERDGEEEGGDDQTEGGWKWVESSVSYSQNVSRYWGLMAGTVRGLPAQAVLGNATYVFRWGLPWQGREEGAVVVGAELRPGTYTTATLMASITTNKICQTLLAYAWLLN
jgi:hypothetical protein